MVEQSLGSVNNRRILYQQFAEGVAEEVSVPAPWTESDKGELVTLRDGPIAIYDTAYGRVEEQKKRDFEQAY